MSNFVCNHCGAVHLDNSSKGYEIKSFKCRHLVLDECSLTGKNCIGLYECFLQKEQEIKEIKVAIKSINGSIKLLKKDCSHCADEAIKKEHDLIELLSEQILKK